VSDAPHETLVRRLLEGDRAALARVLTLIDRRPTEAAGIDAQLARHAGRAGTIGITGAPGAGKSTLVGSMLKCAVQRNERVAVLALDPVSPLTRGAVLGDRLRMEHTTADERVFVRSMTAETRAGGLALATPFAIRALDAAGWPWVMIETVGVGQTEFDIVEAAATTVVVMTPGTGDEVQSVNAVLMEMADVFVLNKADRDGASQARLDIERAVHHLPAGVWRPPVIETVASEDRGTDGVWDAIVRHRQHLVDTGGMARRQQRLLRLALRGLIEAELQQRTDALLGSEDFVSVLDRLQSGDADLGGATRDLLARLLRS
jgi:LAO/AO transport system kinase